MDDGTVAQSVCDGFQHVKRNRDHIGCGGELQSVIMLNGLSEDYKEIKVAFDASRKRYIKVQ